MRVILYTLFVGKNRINENLLIYIYPLQLQFRDGLNS